MLPVMRSSAHHSSTFAECSETSAECRKAQCVPGISNAGDTLYFPTLRAGSVGKRHYIAGSGLTTPLHIYIAGNGLTTPLHTLRAADLRNHCIHCRPRYTQQRWMCDPQMISWPPHRNELSSPYPKLCL